MSTEEAAHMIGANPQDTALNALRELWSRGALAAHRLHGPGVLLTPDPATAAENAEAWRGLSWWVLNGDEPRVLAGAHGRADVSDRIVTLTNDPAVVAGIYALVTGGAK